MKTFQFNLESVLRLRHQVESQRKLDLAVAARAVTLHQRRMAGWFAEQEETRAALTALKAPVPGPRVLDLDRIRIHEGYLNSLARWVRQGFADLLRLRAEEEFRRQALLKASRERRVLERLRERRLDAWRYAADVEERKFLDEVAQQTFQRARDEEMQTVPEFV